MNVQYLIVFFLAAVRCQATESVLDLFSEFKRPIDGRQARIGGLQTRKGGLQTRIDGLEKEIKALKAEIDTKGPNKVAFMAKNAGPLQNIPANYIVVYDTAITNLGNGYDTSTGIFTAPSNGVYIFSWTCLSHAGYIFPTYLAVNGNLIARNHAGSRNVQDHISGSQNAVIEIKKYDKVSVRIQNGHTGQYMYGQGWSTFIGYKL
ncbi:C1QL [Mytilus coruscus]|uniref:C1QL n=1 Tax=Mytilus coruscus TaxID=42192 RepID=A0A6J8CGY5_MYTCO|nr:C1QL [Mytilus coruscus]